MLEAWKANPASVDSTWQQFFENVDKNVEPGSALPPIPRFSKVLYHYRYVRQRSPQVPSQGTTGSN